MGGWDQIKREGSRSPPKSRVEKKNPSLLLPAGSTLRSTTGSQIIFPAIVCFVMALANGVAVMCCDPVC